MRRVFRRIRRDRIRWAEYQADAVIHETLLRKLGMRFVPGALRLAEIRFDRAVGEMNSREVAIVDRRMAKQIQRDGEDCDG